jgi:hypothetical protein
MPIWMCHTIIFLMISELTPESKQQNFITPPTKKPSLVHAFFGCVFYIQQFWVLGTGYLEASKLLYKQHHSVMLWAGVAQTV